MKSFWQRGGASSSRYLRGAVSLLLIASLGLNVYLATKGGPTVDSQADRYPLLSKRIFAESQNDILINFTPLRTAMRQYVAKQPEKIGVYFEYLPSGTSIGVNDQMEVRLASLIKVPVVMAVYKDIEDGKLSQGTLVTLHKEDFDPRFGTLWKRGAGTKLTIAETIRINLVESDNTATRILVRQLSAGAIDAVFDSLDLPKDRENGAAVISPKSYASILRSLYLSSYLEREHSNEILGILTRTNFNDQIPAGVPESIKVAHKIGTFEGQDAQQVHNDCGIIYAPNRPYGLCIMVPGDEATARKHMQYLSKMVYGYISRVER
jgi:beta-lactamase class A